MLNISKLIGTSSCVSNSGLGQRLELAWEGVFKPSFVFVVIYITASSIESHHKCMLSSHAAEALYNLGEGEWLKKGKVKRDILTKFSYLSHRNMWPSFFPPKEHFSNKYFLACYKGAC